jgi:protein O-mannosyl-transferase
MAPSAKRHLWIPLILALAALALYWPVRHFAFLNYDDPSYVTGNLHVRDGLSSAGVEWALRSTEAANWFPLTWISHMADVQAFGLDAGLHHLTNVSLHIASGVLLFFLLLRLTRAAWPAGFVAAVFLLHPLHVESVAWIAERKDVLSAFFWMLTLLAYVQFVERRTAARYILLLLAFSAGLMSKPMIVTLPLVALLLDFWPLQRKLSRALIVEKLPLFGLSAAVSAVVFFAQRSGGAMLSLAHFPLGLRLANAVDSYGTYLASFVWPAHLAVFYPFPVSVPAGRVAVIGALLVAVTAVSFRERRRRPYLLAGWLWYLVTLVPVIGFVQVGLQARADRYTYIPLIGISIMVAWGAVELGGARLRLLAVPAVAALALWAVAAHSYLYAWQDSATLFRHAIEAVPGNYVAHNNLGVELRARGDLAAAIANFQAAVAIQPEYASAQNNWGEALLHEGRPEEALPHVREALRLSPGLPEAHVTLAAILSRQGQADAALREYRAALELDPEDADADAGAGAILTDLGRSAEAMADLTEAERRKPDDADIHYNLGRVYGLAGNTPAAIAEFSRAVELSPEDPQDHFNLGVALAAGDQLDRAIDQFRAAVRLRPDYANAHFDLGSALAESGRCAEAVPELAEALRLRPNWPEARQNIAACQAGR